MRYELTDCEWFAIKPLLPNKPRGVPRVDDRRVLNGIFWVLRSGAPWRDLPRNLGPYTTCYNRFVRWRRAGVWSRIMRALATTHDASVKMIDTSIVRVHQHAACIARNRGQSMGRPWRGASKRADASDCCDVGTPCAQCIPCGGIDEPPDLSRSVMRVMIDAKERPATLKPMDRGDRSRFWSSLTTATALQLSEGTGETQFKSPSAQPQALDEDLRAACQS